MSSILAKLDDKSLLKDAPDFMSGAVQYEVVMGSLAYGVSDDDSDMDIYAFCIPPREYIFPHLRGEIAGFSTPGLLFQHYQLHHIKSPDVSEAQQEYDVTVYSIIKFFRLCMENNPNIIDSLYVPEHCVIHSTEIGDMVRENRKLFLHKGVWKKFKGYATAQMRMLRTKKPIGNRKKTIAEFGYDVKFAYHIVRLLEEVEQILNGGGMDLQRSHEMLRAIRSGDWTLENVEQYFSDKELKLNNLYYSCDLPDEPNEDAITKLLLQCLEQYYGSLESCIIR